MLFEENFLRLVVAVCLRNRECFKNVNFLTKQICFSLPFLKIRIRKELENRVRKLELACWGAAITQKS